jgi:hypothetical protein
MICQGKSQFLKMSGKTDLCQGKMKYKINPKQNLLIILIMKICVIRVGITHCIKKDVILDRHDISPRFLSLLGPILRSVQIC